MAITTVQCYVDEKKRLEYYKGVFGFAGIKDVIRELMNRVGMATLEDIERLARMKKTEGSE